MISSPYPKPEPPGIVWIREDERPLKARKPVSVSDRPFTRKEFDAVVDAVARRAFWIGVVVGLCAACIPFGLFLLWWLP